MFRLRNVLAIAACSAVLLVSGCGGGNKPYEVKGEPLSAEEEAAIFKGLENEARGSGNGG